MEEQLLKDFIATAQANNYNYDVVMPKFPELSGYDLQVLKDYIATAEANNYDYNTVNAKFPELFSAVKKKDTASVSEPGSLVSPEPQVPVAETVVEEEVQDLTVAEPDFFEERMAMVSPQLIDRGDEDQVAQELTDVFKPYGFEVEPTSIGDALKVTASNGETIEVDLDPMELPSFLSVGRFGFTGDMDTETEKSEAKKLQDFLRENRQEGLDAPRKFVTQKQIDTNVKKINDAEESINNQFLSYVERKSIFDAEFTEAFPVNDVQAVAADPEGYNDFLQRGRDLDIEAQGLRQNDEILKEQGRELDKAAGEYTSMLANRGDWGGGLWNKVLTGIGRISEEAYNVAMDKVTGAIPLMTTDPAYYQSRFTEEAERRGITPPYGTDGAKATRAEFLSFMTSIDSDIRNEIGDKVVDDYKKERKFGEPIDVEKAVNRYSQYAASENMKLKGGELEAVRNGLLNVLGDSETTPEWTQLKEQGFWGGAFLGLAESIPAMLVPGGWAARTAAMYGQVASHLGEEMASIPEFQDVSEKEKAMFKLPLGIVVGALESIGFRNVVNQKGLLNSLLMQALKKSPKNVTGKAFNDIVDREVNSMISRGLLKVGAGGLAEFETGLAQEVADITGKEIYNALKEKEMFDTPESFGEGLEQVVIGGLQEAVGGLVLGVPNAVATSSSKKDFTDMDDATFELFQNVSKQTDSGQLSYRHMFYTNLKSKINQGKISKKEAQEQMDNLDEVIAVNRDIPSDLTLEQQKRSLGILLRRKDLQEQIEGKDPILVKRQQEELNSLNRELDQILYGTPETDAIQEPSPETVDAPEPTRGSEAMGEGVPDIGEPTAEVEAEDQVAEAAPTEEVAVEEGAEVELEVTTTDKKGRTLKFFKTTTEKDGVKTTRFTFNRSDRSPEQRNASKVTPVEEALGGIYEVDVPEGLQENGAVPVAVTEVRESESGASATVIFEQDGQRFEGEVVLTPKTQEVAVEETVPVSEPTQEEGFSREDLNRRERRKSLKAEGYTLDAVQGIFDDIIYNRPSNNNTRAIANSLRKIKSDGSLTSSNSINYSLGGSVRLYMSDGSEDIVGDIWQNLLDGEITLEELKDFANKFNVALPEPVAETVSEPTQEVTEEEQVDIDDFFSDKEIEGVDKVDDNLVVNRKQLSEDKAETAKEERKISRIKQIAKKAAVSLKKQFPDVRIVLHETEGQYKRFAGKRARGAYVKDDKTKTIHINLSIADLSTVPHEVFHALLLEAAATDPQALVIARNMLESVRKVVDPNSEMSKVIEKFVAKYEDVPVIQDEEYLAELMGILSSQYRTLDKPSKNVIKEFLRKLAKLVGIDTKFGLDEFFGPEFLERDEQVIDLLNTISGKVSKGQFIEAADVQVMGDILSEATPTEQAQAQSDVRDFKRKQREKKAAEENLLNRSQEYVQDFDELERLNNEGVMFHFGPVDVQEVMPEKLRRMVLGYGIYFVDKAESPTTYSVYATRYGRRVTLVDGSSMNLVDSDSKISKEEFTTLRDAFNEEVAALDEVSLQIEKLYEYINELDLDIQGANPTWAEMLTVMSPDLLPSDTDVIDKPYNYSDAQKMFIAEVTAKALGYDGATYRVGKGSIDEHSTVNVWNFDKVNKNIISDDAVTPRMQVVTEEDGKPVTFYHGTDKKFDKFEPQKSTRTILMSQYEVKTPAIFFTPDEAEAREYGDNIIPVNLQFEKLVEDNIDEAAKIITDYYVKEKDGVIEVQDGVVDLSDYYDEATDSYNNNWVKDVLDEAEGIDWMLLDEEALVEKFKEAGFDGTKVYEGDKAFSVATFYPENIVRLDQGMAPRQQVADAATSIQESLKFADKSSFPNKLEFKRALQERFDNEVYPLIKERYGVKDNRSNTDQGLKNYLVDAYLNETLTAIEAYPDALGWYDARITGAMSLMEKLHPELATDKDAASTFKIALAITSNGNKVYDNFVEANRQYEYYKENGKFDDTYSIGDQRAGILSTLAFTNKALESMSMADFTAFLTTKYRAGDLKYMKDGKKTPLLPGFAVDEEVYGASIFGPKIGNGFFMNLYGEFNQLTMDRWFMRQFGRLTGTLLDYDQKKVDAGTKRLNRATKALAKRNAAKLSEMIPGWDEMSAEELSSKIQKASMDLKKRATFKSNPKLDEVRKAGNNLSKQVSAETEAPRNSSQRKFINEVFTELQAKLKNDYDIDITIADLQAVNWYPEKALYQTFKADQSTKTGKVETSDNEQPDYESAAKKLVEEQGVSKKEIKEDEARRSKQLERNTANREAIEQRAGELNKDDIEASEVKRLKDKIISVKEDVTSSDLEEGVSPRQQVIEDVTAKELDTPLDRQQRVFRSGDLENKAEPRWMFQSGRGTGHFGTGFYFFGTKEQADEYDARDVSEIDIDKYNLAKATKKLHDALKDINTQYNEYYEVEAINELKKQPLRQAVPTFFIEEVAKAAGMGVISEAELEAAATEVTKALTKDGNPAFGDSVSTLVMKALGFEGVNAVGTRMDNSTYGTVIYDIKADAAPRQQLEDIATPLPRQQKSVREVVQQARDNNFKDAATKDFLKRKGVPTADIDKAIKTLDDVYARVMKEIDGVITKSQKRGVDFDTQFKNALAYLQGTKLYEDTTDIHREKLIREVRAKFDKKEKRAPSAKRILGNIKDVKKVTLSEKEALKMQLRLVAKTAKTTARALVVAGNELTKSLKEMVKGGVITANQMSSVLRRFSRVDLFNPASIDSFLDYMAKIFADAEYGAKIARIKKLLPRAKKNIKSKIGVADVLGDTLTKLFNVNPTLIPMEMLEDYQNLLEMMGAAKKVLPLADINDVTEMANKILNAVYEEVSMAEDLAEVFANYENKVIKDGKVDYAATIEAMIADQTISLEEAAVMRKYKSRIVEPTKKEPKTEEELAEERAELMSAVEAAKVNVSRLVMEEERTLARQLSKLMRTEAIDRLSNQQLETLLAVIDNINNGFVTHAAQRLAETMNASNRAKSLLDSIIKAVPLPVSTFVGKIKAGITKNNKFFESIKRNPLAYIDQVFGDFQTTRIYDAVFKPLAQAYDTFSLEMKRVDERLTDAQEAVMKSFKNDPNKARMSSYKMMAYMLQREFEANPDNKQVNPAADFIRATIDHINKGQSFFKGKDAEMLQQILDDFGGEQIDSQKLYDSFNKAERNALAVMEDINKSMGSKAVFTGAVIRGRRVDALNQYAHHNVLSTSGQMDRSADVSIIEAYNQSMRASTKAKNLIERTGAATPLNFDVFSSVSRGSRFTLTDFYLTEPIRTSRKTISDTRKLLEERGDVTKQENEIVNAVENALELTLDDLLTRTFSQSTMLENVIQYVKKTGYRLVLASGTRAMAEGASNLAFAAIYAPKDFAVGRANKTVLGAVGIDVMSNLKSTQISRMYPNEILSGRMIDTSVLGEKAGDKGGRAKSDVLNKATQIYNGLLSPAKKGVEVIADTLISYPDKAVIRPLWFGSFENAFVEITGKKPDFDKIAANDEAYMAANQEALDKATDTADQLTTLAGAADNPFKSMLRGKYPSKAKQTALLQFFNNFNSFMTRFLIYEYISARTAVNAMLGNGMISKRQGAALLGAVTTRMVVYTLAGTILNQWLKQAFGLGDEEDEKDIMKRFGQALASTATSLIVGRDFGNVVKGLLNYGVENLNEEFLDELRDGDYDPYRDAIAYTFVPPDKEYKSNTLADYIRNLMGPFGPFYKMAEFGVKALSADEKKDPAARIRQQRELNERLPLELLGNLGLIPLYRDIRSLLLADIYKGMGKDKKGSSTGMTKAEKAQMKEYFPEMYEIQMQLEEDMKNPELERMMKEQEKAIEEMMKGLK